MRIGFDTTALDNTRSGVGMYTENLLAHMRASYDHQDRIVELSNRQFLRPKINKTLWMQAILPWDLLRSSMDICHFTNSVAPLWTPCPTVLTIHDMTLWLYPQHHYRKRLLTMRPFIPVAARRAKTIIAVSESVKADIVRILGVSADKVQVIYSAPSDKFTYIPPGPRLEAVRERYHLPDRFILYVGTIEPRKNLVRLLEAFALIRNYTQTSLHLVLVGKRGWKDQIVFSTIERLGLQTSVCYLGYLPTDDVVALYNLALLLAFPSLYEGFGLPVLEAMVCRTPIVTSCRGGLTEIAAGAAEFIDPTSIESIAQGLHHVLTDPVRREALQVSGIAQVARFSWALTAEQTRRAYGIESQ